MRWPSHFCVGVNMLVCVFPEVINNLLDEIKPELPVKQVILLSGSTYMQHMLSIILMGIFLLKHTLISVE